MLPIFRRLLLSDPHKKLTQNVVLENFDILASILIIMASLLSEFVLRKYL